MSARGIAYCVGVVGVGPGDPTVYCTFSGIQRCLEKDGYPVELVNGVTFFCAAAARLNMPLVEWDEPSIIAK